MIGLALSGGGVKGSYELGAYLAMKKCHIKIDGISGTSIGAFNGAMIASHKEKELFKFWKDIEVGNLLGINEELVDKINNKEHSVDALKLGFQEAFKFIKQSGINIDGLERKLATYHLEKPLRKSKIDFGICTYRVNDKLPMEIYKEDMLPGKIDEYIIASCYFPIFKPKKIIDDNFYFDGGIYDNCPANMLLKKGYDKVYSIELKAIGRRQKLIDESKVITISPSRKLSSIISFDKEKIDNNFLLGYFDTLKILKNYPGEKYIFKKYNTQKYSDEILKEVEQKMEKDNLTYFKIYSIKKLIKRYNMKQAS